jgi:nicotinamidase/pyrazinamidase
VKPAIIVVDMLKDNLKESPRNPYFREGTAILPHLKKLLSEARRRGFPVFFACDSFLKEDFIFKGGMKVHALRGTAGQR